MTSRAPNSLREVVLLSLRLRSTGGGGQKRPQARKKRASRIDARQQMTDADRELVDQVVEHRRATTQQLSALLDVPERTVRYRMEKLRALGMVGRSSPPAARGKALFETAARVLRERDESQP